MKQMSLGAAGFERKTKKTRKREFLDEMNLVVPWPELVALIAPHTPKPRARACYGLSPVGCGAVLCLRDEQEAVSE